MQNVIHLGLCVAISSVCLVVQASPVEDGGMAKPKSLCSIEKVTLDDHFLSKVVIADDPNSSVSDEEKAKVLSAIMQRQSGC